VIAMATADGRDVVIDVAADNAGARRLYERLGFRVERADEVYVKLRRAARPATG